MNFDLLTFVEILWTLAVLAYFVLFSDLTMTKLVVLTKISTKQKY